MRDPSADKASEEEVDVTTDPIHKCTSNLPYAKQKLFEKQRNISRKQELRAVRQTDQRTVRVTKQVADRQGAKEQGKRFITSQHAVEVDVEVTVTGSSAGQKTPLDPPKPLLKCKSTNPQRVRRKPQTNTVVDSVCSPSPSDESAINTVPSSLSQTSIISESALEELSNLRNYYSKQLRRIDYVSQEHLGQSSEQGVLACIREPLRSIHLPHGTTIAQTARSLWTRVSGRRKR